MRFIMKSFFIGEMDTAKKNGTGVKTKQELCQGICEPTTVPYCPGKQTPSLNQLKVLLRSLGLLTNVTTQLSAKMKC